MYDCFCDCVDIDAWGKPANDILKGNVNWLGGYQACQKVQDGQFCLADTRLFSNVSISCTLVIDFLCLTWSFCQNKKKMLEREYCMSCNWDELRISET